MTIPHANASEPTPWCRRLPWRFGIRLIEAGAAVALVGTLLGFAGRWHWGLDLFAHFRGQYLVALGAVVPLLVVAQRPRVMAIFLAGALANVVVLAPLLAPRPTSDGGTGDAPALRVMTYNLLYQCPPSDVALDWLRGSPADVVFLCEVTTAWSTALRSLDDLYPYQHHCPRSGPWGCAVLCKQPWTAIEEKQFGPFVAPSLAVRLAWQNHEYLLVGMHPTPPNGPNGSRFRDQALSETAAFLAAHPVRSQILLGDLNATPWCQSFRSLTAHTGLADTGRSYGWQPTWHVDSPIFQIPIDHVLVSPDFAAIERVIGPDLGSDHRAVSVALQLKNR